MIASRMKRGCLLLILIGWVVACGGGQSGTAVVGSPQVSQQTFTSQLQPRVGIGIAGLSYWDRSFAMADLGRHSQVRGLDWATDIATDLDGNPAKDFQIIYSATKVAAGTYKIEFNGRAIVSAGGAGSVQNVSYDSILNRTKADLFLQRDTESNLWVSFRDTYRTPSSTKGDGLTNIHMWRPGYPTGNSMLFTNEFITAMKKFSVIRGMDFTSANTNSQTTWAERTKPTYFGYTGENGQSWELLVALGNATDRDIWLNVPVKADNDYIRKLAQLIKFGSDGNAPYTEFKANPVYAPLKPGLRVYVEYGNEVWNSGPGFRGFKWALELANAHKSDATHPISFDKLQTDQYVALRRWIAHRSAVISLTFRDIFGDAAMMGTVRPILAGQVGNGSMYLAVGLQWAQQFFGQIRATPPVNSVVRKPSDIWYGGGGAAYYEANVDPRDSRVSTLDQYFSSLPTSSFANNSAIDSIWTHGYGLKYVAYEGGPGPGGSTLGSKAGASVAPVFNNDPRLRDRMLIAQDIWDRVGGDELVYYVYSGSAPWSFTNELIEPIVSDLGSIKLQAIDTINATAKPPVSLGKIVPSVIYLKDTTSQTIGANAAAWAHNGTVYLLRPNATDHVPSILLPIRTTNAGTYKVSLNISGKVTGTVAVFVNGTHSGLIALEPDSMGTNMLSSKVTINLPAGLSVLRIDTPQGSGDIFVKDVVIE